MKTVLIKATWKLKLDVQNIRLGTLAISFTICYWYLKRDIVVTGAQQRDEDFKGLYKWDNCI